MPNKSSARTFNGAGSADFEAEAALRRLGCRATVFTPGNDMPAAVRDAAPPEGAPAAPAAHVRAYLGPVTALLSDPPVLAMLQALRMAAAAASKHGGPGLKPLQDSDGEDETIDPAVLLAGVRGPPARHTLLHIACNGCEW